MTVSTLAMDQIFAAERLRLHRGVAATSVAASSVMGLVVVAVSWDSAQHSMLLAWLAALALVLAARLGVALKQGRTAPADTAARTWLTRHRALFAAHGVLWGWIGTLLLPAAGAVEFNQLAFALFAMAAGALLATAFDLVAAALFVVPALAPLVAHLFANGEQASPGVGLMVLLFLAVATFSALRSQRTVRETVRLRVAEGERAEEARQGTERAQAAQRALAEQHHLFSLLLRTTSQGYWFIDVRGVTLDVNAAMCSLLGRTREQVVGHEVFEFFEGAELQQLHEQLAARSRGEAGAYEIAITRPDGSRAYCVNNATPMHDTQGQRLGSVGLWTDISARRDVEATLHTYEQVANTVSDMVSVIGDDGVYRMVNDEWCRRLGVAREVILGRTIGDVLPTVAIGDERRSAFLACIDKRQVSVVRAPADERGIAGRIFETTYYPHTDAADGARGAVVVSRDVTAEEAGRRQLADSAEYLRRTLNATGDAIFATDAQDQNEPVRFVNEQMLQMWRIAPDKAASLTPAEFTAHSRLLLTDPDAEQRRIDDIVARDIAYEDHLNLRDGRVLLRRCVPARVDGRRLRVWSFRDITVERRAMQVVQASEAEQRALLDAFPGFIARIDANFVYTYANALLAARLGITPEQMIGRTVREVVGPDHETQLRNRVTRALAGERVTYERDHPVGDGTVVTDQVTLAVGVDPRSGGPAIYAFGVDITDRKRAEEQLQLTGEQLRQRTDELQVTLDSIAQGIVSVGADGRLGVRNRRAQELLDLPESLMGPGATYDEVVRFQIQRGDLAADGSLVDVDGKQQVFRGGRAHSPDIYVRRTRSGALVEVRTRQLAGGGQVRTFADVSAYVQAQQALRALLEAFPGYIAAIDHDFKYTYVNARLAAVLGQPPHQIVGRHMRETLDGQGIVLNLHEIERAFAGEIAVTELSHAGQGGKPRLDLEVTHVAGPVQPDGGRTIYVFGIDITARKRAEEALIGSRDEAERANRAKSLFVSSMSHELRTPMNAILGFGQLLESDPTHPLTGPQREHVHAILRGGRHLLELINEVLDLGRVESGDLPIECSSLSLCELIDDCLALVRPLAQLHHVQLLTPTLTPADLHAWADRMRLKQIVLNLLGNAIKYNRPGGEVAIDCSIGADVVRLAVRDTGRGLTAEERMRLFQPFERLSAGHSAIEGTGIGLALCQRLVHAMGGTIGVESEPGRGSVFWVCLARADVSAADAVAPIEQAALPVASEGQARTVLYIEDNAVNALVMQAMLARVPGVRSLIASLPQQGIDLAQSELPDLVLVDIQMPDMDGFQVLRYLRESPATRTIPAIAVSANAMQCDIDAGLAAGFEAYLTKPLELETLSATVLRVLHATPASRTRARRLGGTSG